ncbi:MAG: TetR/AcrR family transcriptional regulator [Armatimonadetes bacterium]|nr:TetR/AcrR family transcriptional regulator [Armatimonadota bacterium]
MSEAAQTTCVPHDNTIAQRILEAGVQLFARKGYAATSTREIVEQAQITKPMLYYYYKSKEGLCRAALEYFLDEVERRQREATARFSDPVELLVEHVWCLFQIFLDRPDFSRLLITFTFGPDEQVPGVSMIAMAQRAVASLERAAEEACLSGVIREGAAGDLTMALRGAMLGWSAAALHRPEVVLSRGLASNIVRDLLCGFGAPESAKAA